MHHTHAHTIKYNAQCVHSRSPPPATILLVSAQFVYNDAMPPFVASAIYRRAIPNTHARIRLLHILYIHITYIHTMTPTQRHIRSAHGLKFWGGWLAAG